MELIPVGVMMPSFSLPEARSGKPVTSNDLQGQVKVILIFPSVIDPEICLNLARYQENLPVFNEKKVVLLAISTASIQKTQALIQENGLDFQVLVDLDLQVVQQMNALQNGSVVPSAYLVDEYDVVQANYDPIRYPNLPNPLALIRTIRRLFNSPLPPPVTPSDWILGRMDAPVVLIEYSDYQCSHCIELHHVLNEVLPQFDGKVALVHRHLPLRFSHPLAQQAAEAAEAAGAQGKFWQMQDRLFAANCALERADLVEYARQLGLDLEKFTMDLDQRVYQDAVNSDFKQAVENSIKLPPTVFINNTIQTHLSVENLTEQIKVHLARS